MIITLDGRLLVRSRVFYEHEKELEERKNPAQRDDNFKYWSIYTFNSLNRLGSKDDGTNPGMDKVVYVGLEEYETEKDEVFFWSIGLSPPNHIIGIQGHASGLYTPFRNVKNLVSVLERENILCLIPPSREIEESHRKGLWDSATWNLLWDKAKYKSKALEKFRVQEIII